MISYSNGNCGSSGPIVATISAFQWNPSPHP